jgi:hypothetical protein
MSQCIQCGKQNPESLGNKPRKYCSKKCAQKFYHQNTYVKKHKDWGTRTAKRIQEAVQSFGHQSQLKNLSIKRRQSQKAI